jgi:hypothetical protein
MNLFTFQPGMTWRKLGFAFSSDSLAYRKVLDQNPIWNVMELPPPGTVLKGSLQASPSAGATQQPSVFSQGTGPTSLEFYPFDNSLDFYTALSRYSPNSLQNVERVNGYTSDDNIVFVGFQ